MKKLAKEDNWFKQNEKVMIEQAARTRERRILEAAAKREQEELDRLRTEHWMKCPKCGHNMETTILEDIEVENCTFCKGVYFDRSEIEALLLRRTSQRFSFYRSFFGLD
ncbi:MAG: zf-TFIIB domain-containing protein [Halobacteria archaeon]|nr:zf-TFIIB domain-containing protein [Halobacteria archaeon]